MKNILYFASIVFAGIFAASCSTDKVQTSNNPLPDWAFGGFVRVEQNPVLKPNPASTFYCPMQKKEMHWEASDVFNPTAFVKDDKMVVMYRAEDDTNPALGMRTSRIGYAETEDGINFIRHPEPVFYPADDNNKQFEWLGGVEDPRIVVTEDGLYVLTYTAVERQDYPVLYAKARLCVATSRDLVNWEKHGSVFADAYDGKFVNNWSKAGSIVTKVVDGKMVAAKINGKYYMYWGEEMVNLATSDDLIHWTPEIDRYGNLKPVMSPRTGYFDATLVECGPAAVMTEKGILLIYNGKNAKNGDKRFPENYYSGGQALFSLDNPYKLIARLDDPFLIPYKEFEKLGQYTYGGLFIEGLALYKGKWYLYYGCSDSDAAVAIYDPSVKADGDNLPESPIR